MRPSGLVQTTFFLCFAQSSYRCCVEVVGQGNAHHRYVGVGNDFLHIRRPDGTAVVGGKFLSGFFPAGIDGDDAVAAPLAVERFGVEAANEAAPSMAIRCILLIVLA